MNLSNKGKGDTVARVIIMLSKYDVQKVVENLVEAVDIKVIGMCLSNEDHITWFYEETVSNLETEIEFLIEDFICEEDFECYGEVDYHDGYLYIDDNEFCVYLNPCGTSIFFNDEEVACVEYDTDYSNDVHIYL